MCKAVTFEVRMATGISRMAKFSWAFITEQCPCPATLLAPVFLFPLRWHVDGEGHGQGWQHTCQTADGWLEVLWELLIFVGGQGDDPCKGEAEPLG